MISDASRYYGCFLHNVLEQFEGHVSVSRDSGDLPGFYLIEKLPFYVKYSTARVGPWTFNFQSSHQDRQRKIFEDHGECITAFVCGRDGIVAICYEDLRKILDTEFRGSRRRVDKTAPQPNVSGQRSQWRARTKNFTKQLKRTSKQKTQ